MVQLRGFIMYSFIKLLLHYYEIEHQKMYINMVIRPNEIMDIDIPSSRIIHLHAAKSYYTTSTLV
mgnify:CR=1 FL=1